MPVLQRLAPRGELAVSREERMRSRVLSLIQAAHVFCQTLRVIIHCRSSSCMGSIWGCVKCPMWVQAVADSSIIRKLLP